MVAPVFTRRRCLRTGAGILAALAVPIVAPKVAEAAVAVLLPPAVDPVVARLDAAIDRVRTVMRAERLRDPSNRRAIEMNAKFMENLADYLEQPTQPRA